MVSAGKHVIYARRMKTSYPWQAREDMELAASAGKRETYASAGIHVIRGRRGKIRYPWRAREKYP